MGNYEVREVLNMGAKGKPIFTAPTIEGAKALIAEAFNIIAFDLDEENDAADAYLVSKARCGFGIQVAIERADLRAAFLNVE